MNAYELNRDVEYAINKIVEAEGHIPTERFKATMVLLASAKNILEKVANELGKEVKSVNEEEKEEEEEEEEEE